MKAIRNFVATFVVALSLGMNNLQASSLPAKLPIGNQKEFIDWIVTNRTCIPSVTLEYTNAAGVRKQFSKLTTPKHFTTYEQYMTYLCTQCSNGLVLLRTNVPPDALMNFYSDIEYLDDVFGMAIGIYSFGTISTIKIADITNTKPVWSMASVVIPGMDSPPVISVDNGTPYSPTEPVYSNTLSLYSWYSTGGTNRVRITVVAGGTTNTYTQLGWPIGPASMKRVDSTTLQICTTPGSDTIVWVSEDQINWREHCQISWSNNTTGYITVPIDSHVLHRFFKVTSK